MKKYIILAILFATTFINGQSSNMFFWYDDTTNSSWEGVLKGDLYYTDLNGTTQYWSKTTPELELMGTYSLNETFSDGDYTTGNLWTVSSGSYAVVDSVGYSGLAKSLRCATAGKISIPCNQAYGYWAFDWKKGGDANNHRIMLISDKATFTNASGYQIDLASNEQYVLRRYDNGTPTSLCFSATTYLTNFTTYRDSIVRNTNGSFSIYIKGGTFGDTYTLFTVISGTNPIINNTYTSSNYFALYFDAGDMIANIQCQYGMGSMDLNGHEMVKYPYQNSTFEGADTTYFANNGTHSIDTSSTYKYAGSYAGKVISTGVGDTATNFISLASTNFTQLVAGEKYTVEYWANAVGKEGTATYTSNFGAGVDLWGSNGGVITGGATISDGSTSMDSVLTFGGNGSSTFANPRKASGLGQNATNTYLLKFWYLIPTSNDTCVHMAVANAVAYTYSGYNVLQTVKGTWTYVELKIKMVASTPVSFVLRKTDTTTPSTWDSLYLANITLTPIIQPTYTLKIGTKSVTSDTISVIPNVFEKVVYNFQATSAEVNTPIKIYCSQADTGWIDNFSITQAKDLMVNVWAAYGTPTGYETILGWQSAANAIGYGYGNATSNGRDIGLTFNDNSLPVITASSLTALSASTYYMHTIVIDRTDSIIVYKDGVKVAGKIITGEGSIKHTSPFRIGVESYGTSYYFTGQIGETQITTFDDISTLDKTPAQIYARGRNRVHFYDSYVGGTIVGWWFNTPDGTDSSGNGNGITSSGGATVSTKTDSY